MALLRLSAVEGISVMSEFLLPGLARQNAARAFSCGNLVGGARHAAVADCSKEFRSRKMISP
jgi:hypothetical protein